MILNQTAVISQSSVETEIYFYSVFTEENFYF